MNWKYIKASDFCDSVRDGTHDTPKPVEQGYKLVTGKHIQNGVIDPSDAYYISEKDYKKINERSKVDKWDVLMSMIGNGLGRSAVVNEQPEYAIKNIALFKVGNEKKAKWLHYYLSSAAGQGLIYNSLQGSGQPFISLSYLRDFPIPNPPMEVIERVVEVAEKYDDLIQNGCKQIKLLEEAAQRLFREWFIDMRFPGYDTVQIVDGVPDGWNEQPLNTFASVIMGQSPKSEYYNNNHEGLPFHQGVGSYGERFVKDDTYSSSLTRIAEAGSILFSVRAPVGRLNMTKNKIVIGRGLSAMNHREGLQSYLFYLLKERFFKEDMVGNGSIFASISKDDLLGQKFIVPDKRLSRKYNEIASSIDRKIETLDSEIDLLREARDRLLPKLMSGEIEM